MKKPRSRRSPVSGVNDCEVPEEFTDGVNSKHTPNALIINKKRVKLTRNRLGQVTTLFKRKARSNSPKEESLIKDKAKQSNNHKSPNRRNSPVGVSTDGSWNRALYSSGKDKKTGSKSPGVYKKAASNSKNLPGQSTHKAKMGTCPKPIEESSKYIAQKKQKLNEELWEASENGDLAKITQLLKP